MLNVFMEASEYFGRQSSTINTSCYHQSRFLANVVTQYRSSKESAHTPMKVLAKQQNSHFQQTNFAPHAFIPQQQNQATYTTSQNPHPQIEPSMYPQSYPPASAPTTMHMHIPTTTAQTHSQHPSPKLNGDAAVGIMNKSTHNEDALFPMSPSPSNIPSATMNVKHDDNENSINHGMSAATGPTFPKQNGPGISGDWGSERLESLIPIDGQNNNSYAFASFTDNGAWEDLFAHAGFNITSGAFLPNSSGS